MWCVQAAGQHEHAQRHVCRHLGFADIRGLPLDASNFTLDGAWHTYRVEVRFNRIKLLIDGQVYAQTTSNQFLSNRRVGLFSALHEINVRGFKVTRLR